MSLLPPHVVIVKDVNSVWDSRVWNAYNDRADEILFTRWVDQPVVPPSSRYRGCLDITCLKSPPPLTLSRADYMAIHEIAHRTVSERLSANLRDLGICDDEVLHAWLGDLADGELDRLFSETVRDLSRAGALVIDREHYLDLAEQQDEKVRQAALIELGKREYRARLRIRLAASIESPQIPVIDSPIEPNAPSTATCN